MYASSTSTVPVNVGPITSVMASRMRLGEVPGRAAGDSKHPVNLEAADPLRGAHQVDRHEPLVQWDLAVLHDRPRRDGELLLAAPVQNQSGRL